MAFVEKARGGFVDFARGNSAWSPMLGLMEKQTTTLPLPCSLGCLDVASHNSAPGTYRDKPLTNPRCGVQVGHTGRTLAQGVVPRLGKGPSQAAIGIRAPFWHRVRDSVVIPTCKPCDGGSCKSLAGVSVAPVHLLWGAGGRHGRHAHHMRKRCAGGVDAVCKGREVHGGYATRQQGHGVHVLEEAWVQVDGVFDGTGGPS